MKRPYFVSLFPYSEMQATTSAKTILGKLGMNTGNSVFTLSLHRIIKSETYASGYSFDPETIAAEHDGIIVSAANWLSPSFNMANLVDLIEKTRLPVVIVGIGAQSPKASIIPKMHESTERLVRIASETSACISVRGEFSAYVLEKLGVKNVQVTGCPSLLYHYGRPLKIRKKNDRLEKLTVNSTRHGSGFMKLEKNNEHRLNLYLYRVAIRQKLDIVLQSEYADVAVVIGDSISDELKDELFHVYGGIEYDEVRNFLIQHGKLFTSVDPWIQYLAGRDFVVGTRIHGSVASTLSGTPTILLTHDTRTEEMAQTLGIPYVTSASINIDSGIDWNELYNRCDMSVFEKRYPKYVSDFVEFFNKNGIKTNIENV